jgi:hypothetical protein
MTSPVFSTYLIAGGAPAGASILPDELGCLTKRTSINMTTNMGKTMMAPNGTDTEELPRNRNGLLKKASREAKVCLLFPLPVFSSSSVGSWMARVDAPLALLTGSMFRSCAQMYEPASWQGMRVRPETQAAKSIRLSMVRLRSRASWQGVVLSTVDNVGWTGVAMLYVAKTRCC